MKLSKRFWFSTVGQLDLEWLKKKSSPDVIIPYHHLVSDEPVPYIQNLYAFKNVRQFEEDLDFLLKNFEPVTLTEVIDSRKNQKPFKKKSFLLTFDDGLRQVYETVVPILLRKGVPAAFFINPSFVDNKELFFDLKKGLILDRLVNNPATPAQLSLAEKIIGRKPGSAVSLQNAVRSINYLNKELADSIGIILEIDFEAFRKEQKPFMNVGQIKELIEKGFHAGAHSMDHPLYKLIPPEEQIRQTVESVNWVSKTFQLPYKAFAFPHVDTGVSHSFFTKLTGGEEPCLDLILGNTTGMVENHPAVLHRFIGESPAPSIANKVKGVLAYSLLRKTIKKPFVKRSVV
jgi:hypothetical protein